MAQPLPADLHRHADHDHGGLASDGALTAVLTRPAWVNPAAAGVLALGACVLLAVRDPNQQGSYGLCPFKAVTGLDCPGCGMLRGTHALLTGHPGRALDHNIFLPVVLVLGIVGYARWLRRSLGQPVTERRAPRWLMAASAVVVLGFWVIRNLGGPFEYLASTA